MKRAKRAPAPWGKYVFSLDPPAKINNKSIFIDAARVGNKARFVNHSSNAPNACADRWDVDGKTVVVFVAKHAIAAGSEILYDYGGDKGEFDDCPGKEGGGDKVREREGGTC